MTRGANFVEGVYSVIKVIEWGVPQGGVLSPTLFSCFINDVPLANTDGENTLLFADDIAYSLSFQYKCKNKLIPEAHQEATRKSTNLSGQIGMVDKLMETLLSAT